MHFRLEHSVRENRTTFSEVPFFPEISGGTNQKSVFHLQPNRNFRNLFVNGKRPIFLKAALFCEPGEKAISELLWTSL